MKIELQIVVIHGVILILLMCKLWTCDYERFLFNQLYKANWNIHGNDLEKIHRGILYDPGGPF